ncbi:MAG: hypothetical protein OCD02_13225 [Spirochaetaceae bacterium]
MTLNKIIILLGAISIFASCTSAPKDGGDYQKARLENSVEKYRELGIKDGTTEIWEDGMRTDGKSGSYEWWYIDAEFHDGTTIVVTFYTKDGFDVPGAARPTATIDVTKPNGEKVLGKVNESDGTIITASRDLANVQIKDSFLKYVDGDYHLYYKDDAIEYDVIMESKLPMWRPDTGHWYFSNDTDYFAWFVAQPSSEITGTLTVNGVEQHLEGTGYHDHNWGNISMDKVINHWYWGRAKVGAYDIIACDIISEEDSGFTRLPVIMIAKDGEIISDDQSKTEIKRFNTIEHPGTGKFYDNNITYIQKLDDGTTYTVEMMRQQDIVNHSFLEGLSAAKRTLAKLVGANPTYLRILGDVRLTVEEDGKTQVIEKEGLWEQMFFGSNKKAYIWN